MHIRYFVIVALVTGTVGLTACTSDTGTTPAPLTVLDPKVPQAGKTYADWASTWWRWLEERPVTAACESPATDPTGATCGQRQTEAVFFLAGTNGGSADRTACVVPAGKPLFFPLMNIFIDNAGVAPAEQLSDADLQSEVTKAVDTFTGITLTLDGVPVDTAPLRVATTAFSYTLPAEPNAYTCQDLPGVTGLVNSYHGGYWAMISAPSAGEHTIAFKGTTTDDSFSLDVTYKLKVQ